MAAVTNPDAIPTPPNKNQGKAAWFWMSWGISWALFSLALWAFAGLDFPWYADVLGGLVVRRVTRTWCLMLLITLYLVTLAVPPPFFHLH